MSMIFVDRRASDLVYQTLNVGTCNLLGFLYWICTIFESLVNDGDVVSVLYLFFS